MGSMSAHVTKPQNDVVFRGVLVSSAGGAFAPVAGRFRIKRKKP